MPLIHMRAADALVSFYKPDIPTIRYMVPNKIAQYARSKSVIVSARYPAIEFMLGKSGAVYVEPGDVESLADRIRDTITDEKKARAVADQAYERMRDQGIAERACDIVTFVTA